MKVGVGDGMPPGAWLRKEREAAGLTQEELAERAGLTVRTISNLERGRTSRPHAHSIHVLAEALGLDETVPGELTRSYRRRGATGYPRPLPHTLPGDVSCFTARVAEMAALTKLLDQVDTVGGTVVVAISGIAGAGKTALSLHWARKVDDRFPDGQLYANLRGFDPQVTPTAPSEAIRAFLDALGVPAQDIPPDLAAQVALYRSLLIGKRMLLVLDNARDEQQVRPLLPAAPGCMVIVTSRKRLIGLNAVDGAHLMALGILSPVDAHAFLAGRLGADRVAAEPEAVAEVSALCGYLPLALAVAASRMAARPGFPLSAFTAELKDSGCRLDALDTGDPEASVRAAISWSVRQLSTSVRRMFRLLALAPWPDVGLAAAASLAGVSRPEARTELDELAGGHLVEEHSPRRYAMHDLLHAYALEEARASESAPDRREAIRRILDYYLRSSDAAARLVHPYHPPRAQPPRRPGVTAENPGCFEQAMAWFDTERPALLAGVEAAAGSGFDDHAWQLATAMTRFLVRRGLWHDLAAVHEVALAAASRCESKIGQASAHRGLGIALARLGALDDGHRHLWQALSLYREIGDPVGRAMVHINFAMSLDGLDSRWQEALDHCSRALDLFREAGYRAGQAIALNRVGWSHALSGDYQRALSYGQHALRIWGELQCRFDEIATWDTVGYASHHLGNYEQAIASFQDVLRLSRALRERWYETRALHHLGDTYLAVGDQKAARGCWRQALAMLDHAHPDAARVREKLAALS